MEIDLQPNNLSAHEGALAFRTKSFALEIVPLGVSPETTRYRLTIMAADNLMLSVNKASIDDAKQYAIKFLGFLGFDCAMEGE